MWRAKAASASAVLISALTSCVTVFVSARLCSPPAPFRSLIKACRAQGRATIIAFRCRGCRSCLLPPIGTTGGPPISNFKVQVYVLVLLSGASEKCKNEGTPEAAWSQFSALPPNSSVGSFSRRRATYSVVTQLGLHAESAPRKAYRITHAHSIRK